MAKPGGDGDGDGDEAERLLDEGAPLLADGGAGSAAATEDDRAAARQRRRAELQALQEAWVTKIHRPPGCVPSQDPPRIIIDFLRIRHGFWNDLRTPNDERGLLNLIKR